MTLLRGRGWECGGGWVGRDGGRLDGAVGLTRTPGSGDNITEYEGRTLARVQGGTRLSPCESERKFRQRCWLGMHMALDVGKDATKIVCFDRHEEGGTDSTVTQRTTTCQNAVVLYGLLALSFSEC